MNCKKSMATFVALAVAANATGVPVRAEDKSFLERIEALENANWTMTPWRNVLKGLGDLPDDIDKLDEFLLQNEYFDGNLTLAEKIFNAPREKFANYKGYNALNAKRVFGGKLNRYNLTNTCKLATTPEEISNEQEAYDAMLLEHRFDDRSGDVCMSDEAVRDYQQQVNELLEGSWLDLVNGTDLMLHMKDGRVFNCADLLPDGLCRDLILTFTEEGREAAEKMLRTGIFALGATAVLFFVWKLSSNKGVADSNKDNDDNSGPGGGSGPGTGGSDDFKDWSFEKKKDELKRLLLSVQNEICALRNAEEGENATTLQLKLDAIIGNNPTVGSFMSRSDAVTAQNIDELLQRAKILANEVQKNKEEEEERKRKKTERDARYGRLIMKYETDLDGMQCYGGGIYALLMAQRERGYTRSNMNEKYTMAELNRLIALQGTVRDAHEVKVELKTDKNTADGVDDFAEKFENLIFELERYLECEDPNVDVMAFAMEFAEKVKEVKTKAADLRLAEFTALKEKCSRGLEQVCKEEGDIFRFLQQKQNANYKFGVNETFDISTMKALVKLVELLIKSVDLKNKLNSDVEHEAIKSEADKLLYRIDGIFKERPSSLLKIKDVILRLENFIKDTSEVISTCEKLKLFEGGEEEERKKKEQELEIAKQKGQEKLNTLTTAINAAGDKGGNALNEAKKLQTELTNAINALNATAEAINAAADKVDGVVDALNAAVEEAKEQEEKEKREREEERLKQEQQALEAAQTECKQAIEALEAEIGKAKRSNVLPVTIQEAENLITAANVLLNNGDTGSINQQTQALKVKTDALKQFIAEAEAAKKAERLEQKKTELKSALENLQKTFNDAVREGYFEDKLEDAYNNQDNSEYLAKQVKETLRLYTPILTADDGDWTKINDKAYAVNQLIKKLETFIEEKKLKIEQDEIKNLVENIGNGEVEAEEVADEADKAKLAKQIDIRIKVYEGPIKREFDIDDISNLDYEDVPGWFNLMKIGAALTNDNVNIPKEIFELLNKYYKKESGDLDKRYLTDLESYAKQYEKDLDVAIKKATKDGQSQKKIGEATQLKQKIAESLKKIKKDNFDSIVNMLIKVEEAIDSLNKKEVVIEANEMKEEIEEKPAEKKDVIKSVQLSDSIDVYVFEQFRKQRDWQVMVRPENNLRQQMFERNQQQTVQKKDERHLQAEIEQIAQVAQVVDLEQPAVEIPLDTAGRVQAAQAALQAAQGDPENKPLIEEKLELVNRLIEAQRKANNILGIGENDQIMQELARIKAQLEKMLAAKKNEVNEQQVEEKKEELDRKVEERRLSGEEALQKAEAALQMAQSEHNNRDLITEQLDVVRELIQEYRQWLQRQAISNDKILEKLRSIYAQLEEMLNELEEQPKEEKEEPKKDDDDKGGKGGDNGGTGNGMKEDEKKEEKDDENGNSNSNGDGQPQQNDAANAQQDPENHENHSRVDLAYLANVAKHIPECLFTKENLGAAAGVGVAAATSGIPAAIPAAGAAAIGYNTLKCADEKATMELYHKQSLKNLQESLDRRSIWDRLSPATSEQSDAELMNDLSKKFDEEKRLAANRGDMATLYGYDQNDLNNQVGTHVAMAAPARM